MTTTTTEVRRRDPVATRASILEAAERLFVDKGFAAASMSDIARTAGVTKSLIHHHFGSKESLWEECKKQRLSHYAHEQREIFGVGEDETSLLQRSVETYFRFLQKNPEFVRLGAWMNLEAPELSTSSYPDLIARGVEILEEEQRNGRLRDDVEARHMIAMFLSMCAHWFFARSGSMAPLTLGEGEEADNAYLDDLLRVFLQGVTAKRQS